MPTAAAPRLPIAAIGAPTRRPSRPRDILLSHLAGIWWPVLGVAAGTGLVLYCSSVDLNVRFWRSESASDRTARTYHPRRRPSHGTSGSASWPVTPWPTGRRCPDRRTPTCWEIWPRPSGAPPIDRTDLRRAPGHRAGEPRAPSTVGRADTNGETSAAPLDGPTVLGSPRQGLAGWRSALIIVQPDTVVRWHRQWLCRHWTRLFQRRSPGRPSTRSAIRGLVSTMTITNPLWGAPRIHGELPKLGITVSERTVSRLLRDRAARRHKRGGRF
jgi:hypothetical protein